MTRFQGELPFGRVRLNFDVPLGTKTVTITGTSVTKGFLYAAVYDVQGGFRGKLLFENAYKSLVVSNEQSGFGAIDGELAAGEWLLELYNLEGEFRTERAMQYQVDVACSQQKEMADSALPLRKVVSTTHEIEFDYSEVKSPESRWYRGDLHAHTQLSDGLNNLEAATEIVHAQNLDFFFFTEHNITQPKLPVSSQCLFLPGIEVTTDLGHFNVHGGVQSLDLRDIEHKSAAIIESGLNLAKLGHSSISINHPMMRPWHWHYADLELSRVSTFEVCCDPTWSTSPKAAEQALVVLNELWNCGHRIAAIGGSDSHLEPHERNPKSEEPSFCGSPATFVFSHGLSGEGILAGLRNGHVYLERRCGLEFEINQGELIPGQDSAGRALSYVLSVKDTKYRYMAEVVVDGQVAACIDLSQQPQTLEVLKGYSWCRIDIRRHIGDEQRNQFEGCINAVFDANQPIFNQPLVKTWGELMERLESDEV